MSVKNFFKDQVRIATLALGIFYAFYSSFSLFMVQLQSGMFTSFEFPPEQDFTNMMYSAHELSRTYMPYLFYLGVLYIIFSLLMAKLDQYKFEINLGLGIACLIWIATYSIAGYQYVEVFMQMFPIDLGPFKSIAYAASIFGFITSIAMFTVPQIFIGRMIMKQKKALATQSDK